MGDEDEMVEQEEQVQDMEPPPQVVEEPPQVELPQGAVRRRVPHYHVEGDEGTVGGGTSRSSLSEAPSPSKLPRAMTRMMHRMKGEKVEEQPWVQKDLLERKKRKDAGVERKAKP